MEPLSVQTAASLRPLFQPAPDLAQVLQQGRVLEAEVLQTFTGGTVVLGVSGHRVSAESQVELRAGDELRVLVQGEGKNLVLRVLEKTAGPEPELLRLLRAVVGEDRPIAERLLELAGTLRASAEAGGANAEPAVRLVHELVDHVLRSGADGRELRALLARSGLGQEARLGELARLAQGEIAPEAAREPGLRALARLALAELVGPETLRAGSPETLGANGPETLGANGPKTLGAGSPEMLRASNPEMLRMSGPETLRAGSPETHSASGPETLGTGSPEMLRASSPETLGASGAELIARFEPTLERALAEALLAGRREGGIEGFLHALGEAIARATRLAPGDRVARALRARLAELDTPRIAATRTGVLITRLLGLEPGSSRAELVRVFLDAGLAEVGLDLKSRLLSALERLEDGPAREAVSRALAGLEAEQLIELARRSAQEWRGWSFPIPDADGSWRSARLFHRHGRRDASGEEASESSHHLVLGLELSRLGPLRADLWLSDASLAVRLRVHRPEAVERLRDEVPALRAALAGLREEIHVAVLAASPEEVSIEELALDVRYLAENPLLDLAG